MNLLLADENFPKTSYLFLREQGHDIKHIVDEGLASILDERVLELAITERRIIITFDSDFGELIFRDGYRPEGVVFFRWKSSTPAQPGTGEVSASNCGSGRIVFNRLSDGHYLAGHSSKKNLVNDHVQ